VTVWRGDLVEARRQANMLLDYSSRHGLSYWEFWGRCLEVAVRWRETGPDNEARMSLLGHRLCTPLHAEALGALIEDSVPGEALERAKGGLAGWCAAELLRVQGEVFLKESPANFARAENLFLQSLEVARRQAALSWELRAAMSLARLWQARGDSLQAYHLLAPIQARFTEGFDTVDLIAASSLLGELIPAKRWARRA
jgi:predicted ATPase